MSKNTSRPVEAAPRTKCDIKVKVLPKSSRNQIIGKEGNVVRVKLTSPPVGGKANKSLIELLSKSFKIPKGSIEIQSGKTSRLKSVRIHALSLEEIAGILEK